MSRLGNILNAIIAPFGKTLWTGTWSSGSITVPNADKYCAFIFIQGGEPILALSDGVAIRGIGNSQTANASWIRGCNASISGTTLSFENAGQIGHNKSGNHSAYTQQSITEIIGLIPNWGGVVKRLLSKLTNIFSMRGGVCCE